MARGAIPPCEGCGASEARCARNGWNCCAACTHTFDGGETYKFLCWGCLRIIHVVSPGSGIRMQSCRLCSMRNYYLKQKVS